MAFPIAHTVCATLTPLGNGQDDSVQINNAIGNCPNGQVVYLNAGTFTVNNYVLINKSITVRGAGAGVTILKKTNGARPRTSTIVSGTNGILTPVDPGTYTYDAQPIMIIGPSRWPSYDNNSVNLSADGQQGSYTITVASGSSPALAAGMYVLLDELSGASWQPVPTGFGCSDNLVPNPCPPSVWAGDRVVWNMHYPQQKFQDDNGNSNAQGPYDTTPGVPPAAMSWFSRQDRPTNEIKQIASVSGNTVTFTSPLSIAYRVAHAAQLTTFTGANRPVVNAGMENLSAYGGADGALRFMAAAYSWAKNVEVTQWIGEGVAINYSFRIEFRDSYIHTASWPEPGGAGYAISLANGTSEVLIENNISIDV